MGWMDEPLPQRGILALDPATATGFAMEGGPYGCWSIGTREPHPGAKLDRLWNHLRPMYERHSFDCIAVEVASYGATSRATRAFHGAVLGVVELFAYQRNIDVLHVNITSWKAWAGNGRMKKQQAIRVVRDQLGIVTRDDNVAEALLILEYAKAHRAGLVKPKQATKRKGNSAKSPALFK